MRIANSVFAVLLVGGAVPSVGFAQIVVPYTTAEAVHTDKLDHVLPVATVTRSTDAIKLAKPHDGDGFVIGAATVDIKDPDHPMLVFTISNGSESPIPLSSVDIHVATVNESTGPSATLYVPCGYVGGLDSFARRAKSPITTLQPGAQLTVAMPAGPHCGADRYGPRPAVGFLVHVSSDGTRLLVSDLAEYALLRGAFQQLRSESQY